MRVGSLFTGIGGLDLAIPGEHAWMCEYDPHCRTILEQRFPGIPVYPDVCELGADTPPVDILVGGYPCQPFSVAGLRKGEDDPRHLWPHFARLIRVLRPRVVIAENVSGHLRLGFHAVLADLAALGMDVRWGVVRASDVGAPHQRARLFIVATDPVERGVNTDGRVRGRDDRVGDPAARTALHAGAEVALATDALEDRADAAADPNGGRREQRDVRVGRLPVAREDGAQPAADTDLVVPGRPLGSVEGGRRRTGATGDPETAADTHDPGRGEHRRPVAGEEEHTATQHGREAPTDPGADGLVRVAALDGQDGRVEVEPRHVADGRGLGDAGPDRGHDREDAAWGVYGDAVRQWEQISGRPAPQPTDDRGRLMPEFVEWMMGFPAGWTDGASRTQRLKMLGNAVVPQQAAYALELIDPDLFHALHERWRDAS